MSQKQTNEELQQEISWEEAVARFLEQNPDYFQRHPDLLGRIALAHQVGGRAVSLIERQVQVLRDENRNFQRQLRELLGLARDNDALTARLHRFALAMLDARAFDDALDAAADILREEFSLDGVRLLVRGRAAAAGDVRGGTGPGARRDHRDAGGRATPGAVAGSAVAPRDDDTLLDELLALVKDGKPVCGEAPGAPTLRALFGEHATDIKTWALIALGGAAPFGALALASRDPYRFHAGQGTVFLSRLGELLAHGLARHRG